MVLKLVFLLARFRIRKDLLSGTTLVVDRYAHSGVAFTAAKKVTLLCYSQLLNSSASFYLRLTH